MAKSSTLLREIWYFALLSKDIPAGQMQRVIIAGEPINVGRDEAGEIFALRDICPHRAAPLSAGCLKSGTVECPYHGWRFDVRDGHCTEIPALVDGSSIQPEKISVKTYPVRETGALVWVWLGETAPDIDPPALPHAVGKPVMEDGLTLNCHVDHAVIGLMDPAHGPFVHRQWWWRSEHSIHEKAKAFEPCRHGFAMAAHSPSSNSFAYKLLGGKPVTEITFELPGIRTEFITVGKRHVLSFTAVTPEDETKTRIRQVFFSNHPVMRGLSPVLRMGARKFLRQDADMVDLQQEGLRFDPKLMLIDDADTQAKWYHALKREWFRAREEGRDFINPVKAKTLRWRS
jgi:phenylpropionate dioxygenase-like ring-hydroxylating dioxygenase large terminal subunit